MARERLTGYFKSTNQKDQIAYYIYEPQEKPIAIVQISHGMAEYFERYEKLIQFLNENGILVCGNDHLGHGKSVASDEELGFFGKETSWSDITDDLHKLTVMVKEKYPNVPYFLLGHSMGSFLARLYITRYSDELNGVLIVGTGGKNPLSKVAIGIAKTIKALKGDHYRSPFIDKLAFGSFNKKIKHPKTRFDWLTKDEDVVKRYIDDPYCGFLFTTNGFENLFTMLYLVNRKDWAKKVPTNLPIILLSGEEDPVGDYGKGVYYVHRLLQMQERADLSIQLYPNARHEILNETNAKEVFQDIFDWIIKHIS
jgi:alpha-beta hydrolase superfamily lysophospholipase